MIALTVKEIINAIDGVLINGNVNTIIDSISIDTRKLSKGDFFIPIRGENFDGHSFILDSFEKGGIGTLTEIDLNINCGDKIVIKVESTLKALQRIAAYILRKRNIPVVAITGSTGKTTTKDMIYTILSQHYNVHRNQGNFNNHIGLPLTIFDLKEEHEIVVLEMGMSGFGEIESLVKIAKPHIAVITNIGISHIEKLGSKENIFKAKMEIAYGMNRYDTLILNGEDEYLKKLKDKTTEFEKFFVGFNKSNDLWVETINYGVNSVKFTALIEGKIWDFSLYIPGEHNVLNAMLAIAAGIKLNVPIDKIQMGLCQYSGSKMRLNFLSGMNNSILINDCYNASPDSMKAALKVIKGYPGKRKIAILGDMLEMGEYSIIAHKDVGNMVNESNIDILVTVGRDAKYIGRGAVEKGFGGKVYHFNRNDEVIDYVTNIIREEDVILIKGSRAMKMEEIVQSLQERS